MKFNSFLIIIAVLFSACSNEEKAVQETLKPVKYEKVSLASSQGNHTFSGVAKSEHETKLSFKVGGTVSAVNVQLGDRVRKGQLIASINPSDYSIQTEQAKAQKQGAQANVKSAEANMKSANSQLINARSSYARVERLYENNSVSLSDFEKAKSGVESAQAQYNAAKSQYDAAITQVTAADKQVQAAANQVNYTRLVAPASGVISAVNIEANEIVGSGKIVAVISSEGQPEVEVGVPEVLIAKIQKGQRVIVRFSAASDHVLIGTVDQVAYASGDSPTYPVIIKMDETTKEIRPGMSANVTFLMDEDIAKDPVLMVPISAVGEDADGNFVFVLSPQKDSVFTVEKRRITVGELLYDGFEVKGLKENELVATAGIKTILDGMKVRLLNK